MELIWNLCEILFIEVAPGEHRIILSQHQRCPPALFYVVMSVLLPRMLFSLLFINVTIKVLHDTQRSLLFRQILQKESVFWKSKLLGRWPLKNTKKTDIKLACERGGRYLYHGLVKLKKVLGEARGGAWHRFFLSLRRNQPFQHISLRLLASWNVRQYISVV